MSSSAQILEPHTHFTVNDGLPSSEVYQIHQDNKGQMWFATDRGLCKYNGYEFISYSTKDGLTDNTIFGFYPQDDGTVWCSTFNNKLFFIKNEQFIKYKHNRLLQEITNKAVITSLTYHNNELYISFNNLFGYLKITKNGDIDNNICYNNPTYSSCIYNIPLGNSYFTYKDFINRNSDLRKINNVVAQQINLNGYHKGFTFQSKSLFCNSEKLFFNHNGHSTLIDSTHNPIGIGLLKPTIFWAGFRNNGAVFYDSTGKVISKILPEKSVSYIYKDHENGFWVSTLNSGVYYFKMNELVTYFKGEGINKLTKNEQNQLYISSLNGNILTKSKNKFDTLIVSKLNKPANIEFNSYDSSIIYYSDHVTYTLKTNSTKLIRNHHITSLPKSYNNEIILCYNGGIFRHKNNTTINTKLNIRVNTAYPKQNGYYLSSLDGIYDYSFNKLTKLNSNPLLNYRVDDIEKIKDTYYMASLGTGLIVLNEDTIYSINNSSGLLSDICTEVHIENDSTVWVCTNKGVNRILFLKNKNRKISSFTIDNGLPSNEVNDIEIIKDSVWVSTNKGLSVFLKKELSTKISNTKLNLNVSSIKVNDKKTAINQLTNLNHNQNRIEFLFQGVSFKDKVQYRYKIKNIEKNWNYTNNRQATYPSLQNGNYTFILQARINNEDWKHNSISIPITINPPYYKAWWFIILINTIIITILYLFFKYRVLSYNRDITREFIRMLLKKVTPQAKYILFRENGKDVRILSSDVCFIKAAGNYLEIHTTKEMHLIRCKIGEFNKLTPDPIEFLRVHRSYIVRLDKIDKKSSKSISIQKIEISITEKYKQEVNKILF